jgi:hypothetical protein
MEKLYECILTNGKRRRNNQVGKLIGLLSGELMNFGSISGRGKRFISSSLNPY